MKRFVAGIDAGGTGVRVWVADAETGSVVHRAEGPSSRDLGPAVAQELLRTFPLVAACAGITGHSRPEVRDAWNAGFPGTALRLEPDFVIAFHGAVTGRDGVLVLAGTGSVACGQRSGAFVRVGGRGWEYGDEGSGGFLTTEIVRRAVRAADGLLPTTPLTDALCAHLGARDGGEVAAAARAATVTDGRGFLVPWLAERAADGDDEARALFVGAAGWLGRLLWTTADRLGFGATDALPVALAGGLWQVGPALSQPFETVVARRFPNAILQPPDGLPVEGALRLALATMTAPS